MTTKQYATLGDLPKKFTMTEWNCALVYTVAVANGKAMLTWDKDGQRSMDETSRILRNINDGDWKIVDVLEDNPKLKLPLSVTRLHGSGSKVVLVAGTAPGRVSMLYVDSGDLFENDYSEEDCIARLSDGMWTVNARDDEGLQQNVADAKAAVEAALAALATAEAALANHKPYLA